MRINIFGVILMVNAIEGGRDWRKEEMKERKILKKGKDWKDGGTEEIRWRIRGWKW